MIDIQRLRKDLINVEKALKLRGYSLDSSDFESLESERKALQTRTEELQAKRNSLSKQIGRLKAKGEDAGGVMAEVGTIGDELKANELKLTELQGRISQFLLSIPNIPHQSVPVGSSEEENVQVRVSGQPKSFDFPVLDHVDLCVGLGMNFEAAANMSGARFVVLRGDMARLHRALAQFMLDEHTQYNGYVEHYTPYIVRGEALLGTGQLPKFADDLYSVRKGGQEEEESSYLIPTAEVSLTNLVAGQIVPASQLPLKMTAHSPCFRSEAGSHGKDSRGLIRQHQFDKVEMVRIEHPDNSYAALEEMTAHAEGILKKLELPYRVLVLCAGDMGFGATKTYDLEVWVPSQQAYREISSCSNFAASGHGSSGIKFTFLGRTRQQAKNYNGQHSSQ